MRKSFATATYFDKGWHSTEVALNLLTLLPRDQFSTGERSDSIQQNIEVKGGRHSTEVAFALLTKPSRV